MYQSLRIKVPSPVQRGQSIGFVTLDGQQLSVRAERNLEPGAIIDVQYLPTPQALQEVAGMVLAARAPSVPPSFAEVQPRTTPLAPDSSHRLSTEVQPVAIAHAPDFHGMAPIEATASTHLLASPEQAFYPDAGDRTMPLLARSEETHDSDDGKAACLNWCLYLSGCCCLGLLGPMSVVCWVVAFCTYFSKSKQRRSLFPKLRRPAILSLMTLLLVAFVIAATVLRRDEKTSSASLRPDPVAVRQWWHRVHDRLRLGLKPHRSQYADHDYDYDYDYDYVSDDDYEETEENENYGLAENIAVHSFPSKTETFLGASVGVPMTVQQDSYSNGEGAQSNGYDDVYDYDDYDYAYSTHTGIRERVQDMAFRREQVNSEGASLREN
eukprot:TRINITY_DN14151_c0_g2_i1.p1 TRINITY_DN14151_c0_g2~~TRINITY_DN14151_c0_g2_i1.p1  ORF type:complete len:403 (-),score=35.00 TRINITY_DN14151_c0_g2_i1:289-1431(-)